MQENSVEKETMLHGQTVDEESIKQSEIQTLTGPSPQYQPLSKSEEKMDIAEMNPSNMKKTMSPLLIGLILLSLLLAVIAIALLIAYATYDDGICKTSACVKAASRIMTNMDPSTEPCKHFYQYACGGWLKKNIIPEGTLRYGTIDFITDVRTVALKNALEEQNDRENSAIKKAKIFYQSCMNDTAKNLLKGQPLISTFPNMFDWPATMDNWDAVYGANWTAEKALINLNVKFMSQSLINVQVSKDMKNSSSLILYIDQPELGLSPTDYYSCSEPYDKVCLAYLDYMVSLATLIRQERNLTVDTAKIKAEMDRVFELEKAIAGATVSQLIRQDANNVYIRMTVAEVEKDYEVVINGTKINWLSYINALIAPGGVSITADDYVVMYSSEYIQNITSFIATFSGRDIQNYLAWHYVRKVVDGLSKEYTDPGKIYSQVFEGAVGNKPLWKDCVSFMAVEFDDVIGRLYVEKAFLGDNKATVKTMIAEIRKMFLEILEEQKWMDEQTKQKAALKALKIREQVGFPDDLFNDTKMTETYDKLEFKTDDFFDNKRKFYEYVQIVRASRLKKPADPNEWKNGASEINAEYSTIDNTIEFPAGILQTPFFNVLEPRSLNYGGIGTVIGHEITHGFDGSGKDFDENGNLFNWWSEESLKKFNDLTQCFVDQYENFSWAQAGGKKLSGASTLEENIADNGGVRQAYRAYKDYLRNNGREKNLPGLDLTNEQLFFIGFGQIWCSTYTQQYAVTSITDDEHSPGEFRVIGTLQNFPEFSEVFSCKSDDYMNPKKKCHLW